jgi:hypothetical protein
MIGTHMRGRTHMMRIERFLSAIAALASLPNQKIPTT